MANQLSKCSFKEDRNIVSLPFGHISGLQNGELQEGTLQRGGTGGCQGDCKVCVCVCVLVCWHFAYRKKLNPP